MSMKIVINATPLLSPLTGVGNYTYHLATEFRRLKPDFDYTYYYGYFSKRLKFYPHVSSRFLYFLGSSDISVGNLLMYNGSKEDWSHARY